MLNSENVQEDGVYLLENGEDGLIYVGNMVNPATLEQIFGVSSLAALPAQASLFTISLILCLKAAVLIPCVARV
jgi:protein transport protein SEC24